ncbi:hypothetical protein [Nocardioides jensenii]|uniref:hypothetical protein n=1 Tax=Nocardioides jensenii TaxID=1843 RepID=UPI0008343615|nr:hypothetical protein [Nocardioides jensenii]
MAVDYTTPAGQVRLLINDDQVTEVFSDQAIDAFLAMEGANVKLAAAQALDIIADDEALTSKVITSQGLSTDGAAVAESLRERARALRQSVKDDVAGSAALAPRGCFPPAPDDRPWR